MNFNKYDMKQLFAMNEVLDFLEDQDVIRSDSNQYRFYRSFRTLLLKSITEAIKKDAEEEKR